jgi:putative zinc finger protein
MACGFDKGMLAAVYDGEATAEERAEVERHLGSCPECARDLAAMKELSSSLKSLGRASAPASIAESVAREVATARKPGPVARPWIRWGLAAAASLLIGVGIVAVLQDRQGSPQGEPLAMETKPARESKRRSEKPAADENLSRVDHDEVLKKASAVTPVPPAEERGRIAGKDGKAPAPTQPSPEPEKKLDDAAGRVAPKDDKPAVPVIQITSTDVALARAEVEAFLKEREMAVKPGAPLVGRSAYVKDHYLQIELTDEEIKLLEKRLAALKKTGIARTTLESERKRVAEVEASLELDRKTEKKAPAAAEEPPEARGAAGAKAKEEQPRELAEPAAGKYMARRSKVILVFREPPPAKQ